MKENNVKLEKKQTWIIEASNANEADTKLAITAMIKAVDAISAFSKEEFGCLNSENEMRNEYDATMERIARFYTELNHWFCLNIALFRLIFVFYSLCSAAKYRDTHVNVE